MKDVETHALSLYVDLRLGTTAEPMKVNEAHEAVSRRYGAEAADRAAGICGEARK